MERLVLSCVFQLRHRTLPHVPPPFGPWIRPENDELDALEVQVPKTAVFGDRRFSTGFLARCPRSYAGNAVTHELFQRPDGTLGIMQLEEILPVVKAVCRPDDIAIDAGQNRDAATLPEMSGDFRLKAKIRSSSSNALTGMILTFKNDNGSGDHSYRIELDPAARMVVIARPREDFQRGHGRGMTMRLDDCACEGSSIGLYAIGGTLTASDVELQSM